MRPARLRTCSLLAVFLLAPPGARLARAQMASPGPGSAGTASAAHSTLSGTVVDSVTGNPIARALVSLSGVNPQAVLTDAKGRFRLEGLAPGTVYVNVHKPGYFAFQESGDTVERNTHAGSTAARYVQVGPDETSIVVKLTPAAGIAGRVSSLGEPVEDLPVTLLSRVPGQGGWSVQTLAATTTDEDGRFHFPELRPGRYYLRAGPSTGGSGLPPPVGGEHEGGFAAAYYPAAPETGPGQALQLRAGQQAVASLSVQEVPLYQVSGEVTGAPAGAMVSVQLLGLDSEVVFPSATDPTSGKFVSPPLLAGRYRIEASLSNRKDAMLYAGQEINVAGDVSGVRLALVSVPPVQVNVHAVSTRTGGDLGQQTFPAPGGGDPETHPQLALPALVLVPSPAGGQEQQYGAQWSSAPDGETLIIRDVPPGRYILKPFTNSPWYVQSITQGGTDLSQEKLVISPAGQPPIEVEMRDDAGSLQISLKGARATALLLPTSTALATPRVVEIRQGSTQIAGLAPGDYDVLAFDTTEGLDYEDPQALEEYRSAATRVNISPNSVTSVSLEVIARHP